MMEIFHHSIFNSVSLKSKLDGCLVLHFQSCILQSDNSDIFFFTLSMYFELFLILIEFTSFYFFIFLN